MIAFRVAIAAILALTPSPLAAHPVFGGAGGFYGGLLHPLLVPAHLMAIVATAALVSKQESNWRWAEHWIAPAAFTTGLAAGMFAIANAYAPAFSYETVLGIALAAGGLLALARPLPSKATAALALGTGLAVALDSPPDALTVREAIVAQLGTFCGATILLAAVIEGTARLRRNWQFIGLRILGSWIAAISILVLALQFR